MGPCGINEVTCHVSGYDEGGLLTYDWKVRSHLIFVFNLCILTVILVQTCGDSHSFHKLHEDGHFNNNLS